MADRSQLFADIDSMEPERFTAHLADDVTMRFGNAEPIHGRDAVHDTWAGFCEGVDGVSHRLRRWESERRHRRRGGRDLHAKDGGRSPSRWRRSTARATAASSTTAIFIDLAPLSPRPA